MKFKNKEAVLTIIVILTGLISLFIIGPIVSQPEAYKKTMQSLDEKKITIAEITAGTAVASVVIGAVPDDATTPIADQVVELSSKLLLVSGVIVLEKALLCVTGILAFRIMIPIGCVFLIAYFFRKKRVLIKCFLNFFVFGLLIFAIVPASVFVSDRIAATLHAEDAVNSVLEMADEFEGSTEGKEEGGIIAYITSLGEKIASGVTGAVEKIENVISDMIDVISILIICYCVIPIVVMMIIVGIVKFVFKEILMAVIAG